MKSLNHRRILIFSAIALFALGLVLIVPSASRDERLYASLRRTQSALERIEGGKCVISDWVIAFSHFALKHPEIYYREKYQAVKQALVTSGYLITSTTRVTDLHVQTKQLQVMIKMRDVHDQTDAWYEGRFDFDRDEVSVLCRRFDVQLWEQALKHD